MVDPFVSDDAVALTVAIMAGGKSSRMGRDKSFVLFNGRPLIESVLAQVAGLGQETLIITNKPADYAHLGLPTFSDIYADCGPLGGIYTAVARASHPHTLIVACDMPWLNRGLLHYLISLRETADIIVPRWQKYPEPLHAIYSKACLPAIQARLEARELKITGFFGQVTVRYVERSEIVVWDENGRCFTNLNTPEELSHQQTEAGTAG